MLDCVGGDRFVSGLRALRNGGRLVNIALLAGGPVSFDLRELFPRGISIHGTRDSTRAAQEYVLHLLEDGRIEPVIHAVMPMSARSSCTDAAGYMRECAQQLRGLAGLQSFLEPQLLKKLSGALVTEDGARIR